MIRVRVTPAAYRDLSRLVAWLAPKTPRAADLAADAMTLAIDSLGEMPSRGRPIGRGFRELPVKFGRYGYVVRYRIDERDVVVSSIRHARKRR
ncbi:type II toxin-antitoxin system RelE/ParE family toxin [Phenylobacterium sp.]|uniref:type II toxin-antitoxin system RelE/ParE family toxin n=1 Tax=Phenylobacterium sp. TaxID=1871053 RepID=UPI0034518FF8